MSRIINPVQLPQSVVKISYKKESGTGFFIDDKTLVTAFHLFMDSAIEEELIQVQLKDKSFNKCKIQYVDEENDICLLNFENSNSVFLQMTKSPIRLNENWESYGFPYQDEQDGLRFFGSVNELVECEKYDFILNCTDIESDYDYEGMSGSPVIVAGRVVGVVLKQLGNKIGAISINKISSTLIEQGIKVYEEEQLNDIPKQLEDDITDIISNYDVQNRLDNSVRSTGNWILLEGNPGTGKKVNVASYVADEQSIVIGKYFTKVPNDEKPKSLRISRENFFNWIEESIMLTVTGNLPVKNSGSLEERIGLLPAYFEELGEYLDVAEKMGVFFIDGLDEVTDVKSFLDIIPQELPQNIRIVLSCTSRDLVPSVIINTIDEEDIILVSPLDLAQCEYFIQRKTAEKALDFEYIQKIALKSEGHPLYLHYLIDYIINSEITSDQDELSAWIEGIPVLGGNIENYYNIIWQDLYANSGKLWILLILSQLRQPISENALIEMLPSDICFQYYSVIPQIKHLIKGKDKQEIYHNSFKNFIHKQVPLYIKNCNDQIIKFCEAFPEDIYAITNMIYHYSLSSKPESAVLNCNQFWADKLAVNHVEPDLVISDIKDIIELAIDLGNTTELLRLLLLLQRIDFRYNSVLVEYAFEIALGLIAAGKFEHAIKYLVRRNVLLISMHDSIHFLQHFYENEAYREAGILKAAIEAEYRKILEHGSEGEGVHNSVFIVKAQTMILSEGPVKEAQLKLYQFLNDLRRNAKSAEAVDDDKNGQFETVRYIMDYSSSWNNAFLLRYFDNHYSIKDMLEVPNVKIDKSWAGCYASSMLYYKNDLDNYNLGKLNTVENENLLAKDIELLVEEYGYVDDNSVRRRLIMALFQNSAKPELLRNIMTEYLGNKQQITFKNKNGVDFERLEYEKLVTKNNCLGFLDNSNDLSISKKQWFGSTWETDLQNLVYEVHFLEGKLYYYKASNQLEVKREFIKGKLEKIIKSMDFNFDFRSYWQNSYLFPEQIFPLLFKKMILLVHKFDFEGLAEYLELLKSKTKHQLGLYTEGYRKSMKEIIQTLLMVGYDRVMIFSLVESWEEHVLYGVQNRWERTEELLKIYEIYGLLESEEKSSKVFQEMLNTSMGPSWYKESQVDLINTAIESLKSVSDAKIQDFASLLDYASGEMTFQRYVKYNKEEFIGSLIQNDKGPLAIQYYKHEILPPPATLIRNAEKSNFDAPRVGDGYCLGARNINEAGSILNILNNIDCSPYLKWSLCKIFTINDDIFRYVDSYGKLIASTLNEIELLNDDNIDDVIGVTTELINSKKIDNEDRRTLLNILAKDLTESNIERISKSGIKLKAFTKEKKTRQQVQISAKDNFDLFNESLDQVGSSENSEDKLNEIMALYLSENRSIWFNNYSKSVDLAKNNVKKLLGAEGEAIKKLKSQVLAFDAEYWEICREIIWFLEGKFNTLQVEEIYNIIIAHFNYIIRPDEEVRQKYSWIKTVVPPTSNDDLITGLIIWNLNHPEHSTVLRTEDTLRELAIFYPPIITALFKECILNKPEPSGELSSKILKKICREYSPLLKKILVENPFIIDEVESIQNFLIKKNLLEVGINLNRIGYKELYEKINYSIPNAKILTGEVFFEEEHLVAIQDYIDGLNSELLLNEEFCKNVNKLLDEYCYPLEKAEVKKSDKYLRRSFFNDQGISGRYIFFAKHALNNAISSRVAKDNIDRIYEIVNS